MVSAFIAGFGSSFPTAVSQDDLWQKWFRHHYNESPLARRMFTSSQVSTRHAAIEPYVEDVSQWSTQARMKRYVPEAVGLGKSAVQSALDDASMAPDQIGLLVVTSCTGYATPGLDLVVAHDVGFDDSVRRVFVGHMGCHAAIPSLEIASNHAVARGQAAVVLCVELPSLHMQPPTDDIDQVVAHALFSDAAAAVVVVSESQATSADSFEVIDFVAATDFDTSALMKWNITDLGFRMELSQKVPEVLSRHVGPLVDSLLSRNELERKDVNGWAVHPGGPRILDVIQEQLALSDDQLQASRDVLNAHGNCSSATVLVVMQSLHARNALNAGDYLVAMAFGPGLTLQATLLRLHR